SPRESPRAFRKVPELGVPEMRTRANIALPNVYLGLGLPAEALNTLGALGQLYERFDELTPQERKWTELLNGGPHDLALLEVVANLGAARLDLVKFVRDNPKKQVPPEIFQANEKAVESILQKIPPQKQQNLQARLALIQYLASTDRLA